MGTFPGVTATDGGELDVVVDAEREGKQLIRWLEYEHLDRNKKNMLRIVDVW